MEEEKNGLVSTFLVACSLTLGLSSGNPLLRDGSHQRFLGLLARVLRTITTIHPNFREPPSLTSSVNFLSSDPFMTELNPVCMNA
jgi:hypothetical protein